jgi:FkbM family methyltransferase
MIKNLLRKLFIALNLPLTKNLKYDILTKKFFKKFLHKHSNTIDIGCHKGEILDEIIKIAPQGKHLAFEPIPVFFNLLKNKYNHNLQVTIYAYAVSDSDGKITFNYVKNAPAYSGIKKRKYNTNQPNIEEITVDAIKLDSLNINHKIDLIKIDVEGAEYKVLAGAFNTIMINKSIVIFEFGKGASDYYHTTPQMIFDYFDKLNMSIYNLSEFFKNKNKLSLKKFIEIYEKNTDYIFIAMDTNVVS